MHATTADALIHLLAARLDNRVTSASIVDWATDAMLAGDEKPSLVILAGLDRNASVFEIIPWLDKTLAEFSVAPLPPADVRRAYVGVISRALLAGRITPGEALDSVHQNAVSPLGHPPDLAPWCYVWERLNPVDFSELSGTDRDVEARRLAIEWASHPGLSAPSSIHHEGGA